MTKDQALRKLEELDKKTTLLSHIHGVLIWDQEQVPSAGIDERAQQMGLLEKMIHNLVVSPTCEEALSVLGASDAQEEGDSTLDERSRALIRHYWRNWKRSRCLDANFVQHFAEVTGRAHTVWATARREDDFSIYETVLSEIVSLIREKVERIGYDQDPYDPLIDAFEPGTTTQEIEHIFSIMKNDLQNVLGRLATKPPVEDSFLYSVYPEEKQEQFCKEILDAMGYDWKRGAFGVATHPYTIALGSDDIRITTRYTEPNGISPLYTAMHEGGHALYELGSSNENTRGTSLAGGASYAFHESQSRLWENIIGRSFAFWSRYYPRFSSLFPIPLSKVGLEQFLGAVNRVKSSPIRVDADEVTYGLHIILRFELERKLLTGQVKVSDLPAAWDDGMEDLLGIRPKTVKEGVLQDVHWSMGEFGYFPTYALGNLYGAQIYHAMNKELDVMAMVSQGEFTQIRLWLERAVYRHGSIYRPKELLKRVTGEDLNPRYYYDYLVNKYIKEQ